MMKLLKNTKVIGGLVVVVGLCVVLYYYWGGGDSSSATVTVSQSPASQELLVTLGSLHSIKLDPAIFSDPIFNSLTDFGVTIPPEPAGRGNPFAPASATNSSGTKPAGQ